MVTEIYLVVNLCLNIFLGKYLYRYLLQYMCKFCINLSDVMAFLKNFPKIFFLTCFKPFLVRSVCITVSLTGFGFLHYFSWVAYPILWIDDIGNLIELPNLYLSLEEDRKITFEHQRRSFGTPVDSQLNGWNTTLKAYNSLYNFFFDPQSILKSVVTIAAALVVPLAWIGATTILYESLQFELDYLREILTIPAIGNFYYQASNYFSLYTAHSYFVIFYWPFNPSELAVDTFVNRVDQYCEVLNLNSPQEYQSALSSTRTVVVFVIITGAAIVISSFLGG